VETFTSLLYHSPPAHSHSSIIFPDNFYLLHPFLVPKSINCHPELISNQMDQNLFFNGSDLKWSCLSVHVSISNCCTTGYKRIVPFPNLDLWTTQSAHFPWHTSSLQHPMLDNEHFENFSYKLHELVKYHPYARIFRTPLLQIYLITITPSKKGKSYQPISTRSIFDKRLLQLALASLQPAHFNSWSWQQATQLLNAWASS